MIASGHTSHSPLGAEQMWRLQATMSVELLLSTTVTHCDLQQHRGPHCAPQHTVALSTTETHYKPLPTSGKESKNKIHKTENMKNMQTDGKMF